MPSSDSRGLKIFTDEDRDQWTHRLANLVLQIRYKNSSAQNYDFDTKKDEYFSRSSVANFALTNQGLNAAEWTPETLKIRQEEFLGVLRDIWEV